MNGKLSRTKIILIVAAAVLLIALLVFLLIPKEKPSAIELNKSELTLKVGETASLSLTNVGDGKIEWSSVDVAVATVTDGMVTALAPGKTTIMASVGTVSVTCSVTVTEESTEPSTAPTDPTDPTEPPMPEDPPAHIRDSVAGFTEADWKALSVDTATVWGTNDEAADTWGLRGDLDALEKWKWFPAEGVNTFHNPGTQFIAWPVAEETASDGIAEAVFANKVAVSKSRFVFHVGCDTDNNYINVRLRVVTEDGTVTIIRPKSFATGEYTPAKDGWGTIHKSQWIYGTKLEYDFSPYVGKTVTILIEQDAYSGANPTIWLCKMEFLDGAAEVTKVENAMWVIGDSIMTQEFSGTMVSQIAEETGYTLLRDTISGSTIAPASGIGIVDHIKSGLYQSDMAIYGDPKVILIQRGSNDLYWSSFSDNPLKMGEVDSANETNTYGAIRYTLDYLTKNWPKARIIWSTTLFRTDVEDVRVRTFNENLKKIAKDYEQVEVLDLYTLSCLDKSNAGKYTVDGIHPSEAGQKMLKTLWVNRILNRVDQPYQDVTKPVSSYQPQTQKPKPDTPDKPVTPDKPAVPPIGSILNEQVAGFGKAQWDALSVDTATVWGTDDANALKWGLRGDLAALAKWKWYPASGVNTVQNNTQFIAWATSEETASDGIAEAVFANKVHVSGKKFVLYAGCDTDDNYVNIRVSVVRSDGSVTVLNPSDYTSGEYIPMSNGWGTIHKSQWVYGTKLSCDLTDYVGETVTILIEQDAYSGANPTIWLCKMEFLDLVQAQFVTLDKTEMTLNVGESASITATASQGTALTWETSDATVAAVADGVVHAVAPGTATITAWAGEASAECTVTVVAPSEVTLSHSVAGFDDAQWKALEVDNATVWGTNDADPGTWGLRGDTDALAKWKWYPAAGVATLKNNTQFIAWAVSDETASDGAAEAVFANKVAVTMDTFELSVGCDTDENYINIRLSVVLEDGTVVTLAPKQYVEGEYLPAENNWGAVHKSQWVYGTKLSYDFSAYLGSEVTILIEQDAYNAANPTLWLCKMEFTDSTRPEVVTLSNTEAALQMGESTTITASTEKGTAITWETSNPLVATVSDGVITAVAPGTATITARAGEASAECTVTVVAPSEVTLSYSVAGFDDAQWKALEVDNATAWGTNDADPGTWGLRGDPNALAKWKWIPAAGIGTMKNNTQFIAWPTSEETASDGVAEAVFANKVAVSMNTFALNLGCDTDDNFINIRLSVVSEDGAITTLSPKSYTEGEYIPRSNNWGTVHKGQWVYGTKIYYDFSAYVGRTVTILIEQDAYNAANPTLWLCKMELANS